MHHIILFALLTLLSGCAANPEKVEQVADAEAAKLQPPTRPLSMYSTYTLRPMQFAEAIRSEDGKLEEGQEFEQNLQAKLLPLLDTWNTESQGSGTLVIETQLVGLRVISGANRFWAGGLAGDSFIDLRLVLKDDQTDEVLSDVRIFRNSSFMAGAWSIGKSDQNLDDYVTEIVYEYLSESY